MTLGEYKLKYVIEGDDRMSRTFRAISGAQEKTTQLFTKGSNKLNMMKSGVRDIASEIPGIGRAVGLIKNPIVIAGAAMMGTGALINNATQKAAEFNSQFRELQNLNLDKTREEMNSLKQQILDLSYNKGFDPAKVITGYFDIQSITGKFGNEVQQIVSKQGEFAKLFNADFNSYIEGTGKAMANYGFGADQLDAFNRSAYATYATAKINFDELSKVQAVYAGPAAAAKQSFDTANKVMSLFTKQTKSAEEAATLTKSAFNDLTKDATRKAFTEAKINMYLDDGKTFKQADKLILELNQKFMNLKGDKAIMDLKNKFTGSEGLIALIQAATDRSGALQTTLNGFDSTKLGLSKAMAEAKRDLNYINDQLEARTKVLMIEIGQKTLPLKAAWLEIKSGLLDMGNALVMNRSDRQKFATADYYTKTKSKYPALENPANATREDIANQFFAMSQSYKSQLDYKSKIGTIKVPEVEGSLKAYKELYANAIKFKNQSSTIPLPETKKSETNVNTTSSDSSIRSGLDSVASGGNSVKYVNVKFDALVKEIIYQSSVKESAPQVKGDVIKLLVEAISGAEQVIATS